ncbi:MAG TPA: NAD(P)-dependent oxidoreductase [Thermoleophilaceae bacterium]|jgi:nucleoside-diphosphate-sugar epimerase|nr:NAD(P)-dependent oxidoreductase [Thermoleophilaceae bacterium]
MRVFLAGATGAIGRPLVPRLIAAGHELTTMTRSERSAEALRGQGAHALELDVFDREGVRDALVAARPDAVVHELTALPHRFNPRDKQLYAPTNRVRTEGTRNLLAAAAAAGARRFVCQSIAFAYAPGGARVKTEEARLFLDSPPPFGEAVKALEQMEGMVLGAEAMEGLVLRYGWFYGPGTYYAADGSSAADVRRRRFPLVGKASGVFSFIHVDDAADATVAALERGAPGAYNVVDDEPAAMREWLPVYAKALGAKPPRRVPAWLARIVAGKMIAEMAESLPGASSEKAKRELGWAPAHPSWRTGFAESLRG